MTKIIIVKIQSIYFEFQNHLCVSMDTNSRTIIILLVDKQFRRFNYSNFNYTVTLANLIAY